jgi:hypothetical protein
LLGWLSFPWLQQLARRFVLKHRAPTFELRSQRM